jgi:hypothetical protein
MFDDLNYFQWAMLAVLAAMYVLSCVRMAVRARNHGRSVAAWFFLTLFFTAIPAAIVFHRDFARGRVAPKDADSASGTSSGPAAMRRCPHCGKRIFASEISVRGPVSKCPNCNGPLSEDRFA